MSGRSKWCHASTKSFHCRILKVKDDFKMSDQNPDLKPGIEIEMIYSPMSLLFDIFFGWGSSPARRLDLVCLRRRQGRENYILSARKKIAKRKKARVQPAKISRELLGEDAYRNL